MSVCLSVLTLMCLCVCFGRGRGSFKEVLPCSDRPATPLFDDLTGSQGQLSTCPLPARDKRRYYTFWLTSTSWGHSWTIQHALINTYYFQCIKVEKSYPQQPMKILLELDAVWVWSRKEKAPGKKEYALSSTPVKCLCKFKTLYVFFTADILTSQTLV